MSPCILTTAPSDCTSGGATYMQWRIQDFPEEGAPTPQGGAPTHDLAKFSQKLHEIERIWTPRGGRASKILLCRSATDMFWIKLLDAQRGPILSTQDWSDPREGIRIMGENDGKLKVTIFRQGTTSNRFKGEVLDFNSYIGSWLHVAVVSHSDPRFEIYFNGMKQIVTQGTQYSTSGSSSVTLEPKMRMKLGAQYVTFSNTIKTKNMILDNLMLFDKPLTQADIVTCA